jgi:class 3 adenylate cyclase
LTASTQTFVFADLAGYTALTEAHGDEQAADTAAEFFETVRALLADHDAEEVKVIGDAMLLRVLDAAQAAGLAERVVCDHGQRHLALGVRIGMHTGPAVRRDGDWFGSAVNLASRIADEAQAGEILCSQQTRAALGPAAPLEPRGERTFKNVAEPVALYELVRQQGERHLPIDPVCRMAVDPELAVAMRTHDGVNFFFCSARCVETFDARL